MSLLSPLFSPSDGLSEAERDQSLRAIVRDGMASQAMASLTGSAFLVAFALQLGASNALIGLLAAIPHLAQLAQVPGVLLVDRLQNRKLVSFGASLLSRFAWLGVAAAPLFLSNEATLVVLVFGLMVISGLAALSNCGWNSWMHDLVPGDELGVFFGRRLSWATATGIAASLSAAGFIEWSSRHFFADPLLPYSVAFAVAAGVGLAGLTFLLHIPEPQYTAEPAAPVRRMFVRPFQDGNFRNLMAFLAAWNGAMYLATPFFTVYMLDRLGLRLSFVIGLIVLGRVINVVFLRVWSRFADRITHKSVLTVCAPLCLLCIFGWTFTTLPEQHAFTIPLLVILHVLMGVAMAGITLATGNIGMKLAPDREATSYLAAYSVVNSAAAGATPILGGLFADFFVEREVAWTLRYAGPQGTRVIEALNFQQWDFLFGIALVAGFYALYRLSDVVEYGEVGQRVVLNHLMVELGREIRSFSSVGTQFLLTAFDVNPRALLGRKPNRRPSEAPSQPDESVQTSDPPTPESQRPADS